MNPVPGSLPSGARLMGGYIYTAAVVVKLLAGFLFIGGYIKSHRKSALYLASGWVTSIPLPFPSPGTPFAHYEAAILGISASLTLTGILHLLEEELERKAPRSLHIAIPSIPITYGLIETFFGSGADGTYVVVGVLLSMGGVLSCEILSPRYKGGGKAFGAVLAVTGILSALKPIAQEYTSIPAERNAEISLLMALVMAAAYYSIILSPKFMEVEKASGLQHHNLTESVILASPEEFLELAESLTGYPVLAFLRGEDPWEGWITYRFQTVQEFRSIHPRNLYYITDTVSRYLKEMKDVGRAIVVLDSPEFLRVYNDFPSVIKLLTTLKDMIKAENGTFIIVSSPETWEEREWKLLQRALL